MWATSVVPSGSEMLRSLRAAVGELPFPQARSIHSDPPSFSHGEGSELAFPFNVGTGGLPPAGWSRSPISVVAWNRRIVRPCSQNFYRPSPCDTRTEGQPGLSSLCSRDIHH